MVTDVELPQRVMAHSNVMAVAIGLTRKVGVGANSVERTNGFGSDGADAEDDGGTGHTAHDGIPSGMLWVWAAVTHVGDCFVHALV